jgi:hypothetical protein
MSTRIPLTEELLHEALRVPSGAETPAGIVDAIMAEVVTTPPHVPRMWPAWSLGGRRAHVAGVLTVAIAVVLGAIVLLRQVPATSVGGPSLIGPAVVAPPTSRYAAATRDLVWLPSEGSIARLHRDSLTVLDTIPVTDDAGAPATVEAVLATDEGVWAVLPREFMLILYDTTTGAEIRRVGLPVAPYALAVDGPDLWVTSFDGGTVMRVDSASGDVLASVDGIAGPTGIAVTDEAVWVAANRSSRVVRIDRATDTIAAQVMIGVGRPHSIVAGPGGVWTSNGTGRSVSRIDPATTALVATIPLDDIAYDVEIAGDSVWATSGPEGDCQDSSSVTRIDQEHGLVVGSLGFPCAWALVGDDGALWVNGEDDRGTLLAPVVIGDGTTR